MTILDMPKFATQNRHMHTNLRYPGDSGEVICNLGSYLCESFVDKWLTEVFAVLNSEPHPVNVIK